MLLMYIIVIVIVILYSASMLSVSANFFYCAQVFCTCKLYFVASFHISVSCQNVIPASICYMAELLVDFKLHKLIMNTDYRTINLCRRYHYMQLDLLRKNVFDCVLSRIF